MKELLTKGIGHDKFKDSPVGRIPEEWEVVELRDVVDGKNDIVAGPFGSNLKVSDYTSEGVPIIRLQNIERNKFIDKDIQYTSPEKAEELSYHSYQPGDLVLAKLGDPIGKTCIVPTFMGNGLVVADVVRIRLSPTKASAKFMEYLLNSHYCSNQLKKETIGSTRPRVNITQVRNLNIPLPPLPEQRRIAEVLSTVDGAIQNVTDAIKKTERLKRGLMQRLLTEGIGHEKFKDSPVGRIPEVWGVVEFREAGDFQYGYTTSSINEDTGTKFLRITDIEEDGSIDWDKVPYCHIENYNYEKYELKKGDVLFARIGATAGKTSFIERKIRGIFASYLIRFQSNRDFYPKFVFYFTQSHIYWSQAGRQREGQLKKGLNATMLSNLKILKLPLPEQQKIAEILSTVDGKLGLERKRREKFERIKRGLMSELLTGRKRVKEVAG